MSRDRKKCEWRADVGPDRLKFGRDGIYVMDGDERSTRIAAPILVTAYATSNPNTPRESAFTVIEFLDR